MLKQVREFLRLYWVSGIVLVTTLLLVYWVVSKYELAFQRDPDFSFDDILTTLAGVLTSIVVTTFSAVFVALQLASGQFSPRIVRGFFREDWRVQLVLTLFVLCVSYCLVLKFLGLTRVEDTFLVLGQRVNYAAPGIVTGILLVLMVFPYFVYYIIRNINAAKITRNISDRTIREIEAHFQRKWTFTDPEAYTLALPPDRDRYHAVTATGNGYLSHLAPAMLKLTKLLGHKVYITKFVGSFISKGATLALVDYQGSHALRKRVLNVIVRRGMSIHDYRSYTQDINFGIRQLVDIAVKAISPAVNDPTTAITCLNYLGDVIREFGQYRVPSASTLQLSHQGVYVNEFNFDKVVDHAFNQIYFWGRADPILVRHMVHVITEIVPHIQNPHNLCVLIKEVEDFELLGKSHEELRRTFVLGEHVHSLQKNYLGRFIDAALEAIAHTFSTLETLPQAEHAHCLHAYQTSLERLQRYRTTLMDYRASLPRD